MNLKVFLRCMIFLSAVSKSSTQYCTKEAEECSANAENVNNFDIASNKYLKLINEALDSYQPCETDKCSCHIDVLRGDFAPYEGGITKKMIDEAKDRGTVYQIINNKIYRQKDCNFPARCSGVEYFIKKVAKGTKLPDMEIVINVRDYPQVYKRFGPQGVVLSFSKTDDYKDIMYPAWSFWEGGPAIKLFPTGIGRFDLLRNSLKKASEDYHWIKKSPKAFFRGSRTSNERDALVLLSRSHPELVDAQYTKNQAWKSPADTLNSEPADEVSFEDHCKYKFLFNYRGVAASFRLKHLFLCKSLVFHVGDEWQEFFYNSLKPWVHYIPVDSKSNEEELKEIIEFFRNHDDLAKEIAHRGYDMIWNNLRMNDVECYWRKLLTKYGKLVRFIVVRDPQFMEMY